MRDKTKYRMSVVLNLILIVMLTVVLNKMNFFNKVISKLENRQIESYSYPEYSRRVSVFDSMPVKSNSIIFLGDSLIAGYEWSEKLENNLVINRGISGDTINGVSNRLEQLKDDNPSLIILKIGINDLSTNKEVDNIFMEYQNLISKLEKQYSNSKLILNTNFIINEKMYSQTIKSNLSNKKIVDFNQKLIKTYSQKYKIIDVNEKLKEKNNNLKQSYTYDGLHLNNLGYEIWLRELEGLINE